MAKNTENSKCYCGWINLKTGESGKFNKNNNQVLYSWFDRIRIWLRNWRLKSNWEFSGTLKGRMLYDGLYTGDKIYSIYVNHFAKKAKTQSGDRIDYNTWMENGEISFI